jgi:lysophospholipase L1-like esterase
MFRYVVLACSLIAVGCVASSATSAPRPLRLVALGDSIPYGADCGGCTGYVDLYARRVRRALGAKVIVLNRAEHNGLDSTRLLAEVRRSSSLRAALVRADIVTLTIGHNDTPWVVNYDACDGAASDNADAKDIEWSKYAGPCVEALATKLRANVAAILAQVRGLRARKRTLIRVTNFHNDNVGDPGVPRAADGPTKGVVDAFSKAICGAAAGARLPCADVYHAFNGPGGTSFDGRLVAEDHVHPNQRGQTLIANLLAKLGYAPLRR